MNEAFDGICALYLYIFAMYVYITMIAGNFICALYISTKTALFPLKRSVEYVKLIE